MTHPTAELADVPRPLRYAVIGAMGAGLVGGIVGLVLGLSVYVPTAWFAVIEIGLPAAVIGGVVGLIVGGIVSLAHQR